jgi:hypothetical protein
MNVPDPIDVGQKSLCQEYICVRPLCMCPHTALYMCPHTAVYVCPHTTAAVSGMYVCPLCVFPHAALYMCPHANVCQEAASREAAWRIVRLLVD